MELLNRREIRLEPRQAGSAVPLTQGQLACWNIHVGDGTLSDKRISLASVRTIGPLDAGLLSASLTFVAQRHESLRTRIVKVEGVLRQEIDSMYGRDIETVDLSSSAPSDRERKAQHIADSFKTKGIDLAVGPLFEAVLIRLSKLEHIVVLLVDHMVSDAASCAILREEVWSLYSLAAQGLPFFLPPLLLQFADYAVWEQKLYRASSETWRSYWQARLSDGPRLDLPVDRGSHGIDHHVTELIEIAFGQEITNKMLNIARCERTLLPLLVLTVVVVTISRWCQQRDLIFAFGSHGRHFHRDLKGMIGLLAQSFPFRIKIDDVDSFLDVLNRVNCEFRTSIQHPYLGEDTLPMAARENASRFAFNWMPSNLTRLTEQQYGDSKDLVSTQPFRIAVPEKWINGAPFWLMVGGTSEVKNGIVLSIQYRTDLFSPSKIEQLGRNVRTLADALTRNPGFCVSTIGLQ